VDLIDPLGLQSAKNSQGSYAKWPSNNSVVEIVEAGGTAELNAIENAPKAVENVVEVASKLKPAQEGDEEIVKGILEFGIGVLKLRRGDIKEGISDASRGIIEVAKGLHKNREEDKKRGISHSDDPNELIGPGGTGPESYIASGSVLPYRINFENES